MSNTETPKNVIKPFIINPKGNSFMIFGLLLLGVFAITAIFLVEVTLFDETETKYVTKEIPHIIGSVIGEGTVGAINIMTIPMVTLSLYAIGFFVYVGSFAVIAMPVHTIRWTKEMYIRNFFNKKRTSTLMILADYILTNIKTQHGIDINGDGRKTSSSHRFLTSLLYLHVRNSETQASEDVKFSFSHLMYARSALAVIAGVIFYTLKAKGHFNPTKTDEFIYYSTAMMLAWISLTSIYYAALNFYEKLIIAAYITNLNK